MGRRACLGVLLVLAAGCSRESPVPPPSAPAVSPASVAPLTMEQALARSQDIEARRANWRSVPGVEGDVRFVTLYDSGVARLVEERFDTGIARYYLDTTGRLFLYESRTQAGEPPRAVELRLAFEPDGRMVASHKSADGRLQAVDTDEIDAVLHRLEALRAAPPRR